MSCGRRDGAASAGRGARQSAVILPLRTTSAQRTASFAISVAERRRRRVRRHHALGLEGAATSGAREDGGDLAVEAGDDVGRRALRRQHAIPHVEVAGLDAGLGERRHARQLRQPLLAAGRQRDQLAGLDVAERDVDGQEHVVEPAAEQVGDGAGGALERHVQHLRAGLLQQQRHREVVRRADARRAVGELAGMRLRLRDHRGDRIDLLHCRVRHQQQRSPRRLRDRREVGDRVVRQRLEQALVHDERVDLHEQRVAVGLGARDALAADVAAGAGDVVDDDGLAERLRQVRGELARDEVDSRAGRVGHDQRDVLLGPRRLCRAAGEHRGREQRRATQPLELQSRLHRLPPHFAPRY